ncbi:MAG: SDR family oxidoreductase [Pseudomonadales bacterium]|jgi:NAD(P)-dependent dehydrogenase (short-subunit alcohol dehydrogenase family)|nr:SDR family oxidoreductase [Pseudomonadales bacterium]
MVDQEFAGRDLVVTGGTGALGRAVVELLLERGARVHVPCFDARELEGLAFRDHARIRITEPVDLSAADAVERFYASVPRLFASIHVAGGFAFTPLEQLSAEDVDAQVHLNTTTCMLCCRAAAARMKPEGGRIVNVTARPALDPRQGAKLGAYVIAKAGVAALTQLLASELMDDDILVNAIAPSVIDTPTNREAMADADFSTWVSPADAAEVVAFLASPRNRVVSGALVPVYGKA